MARGDVIEKLKVTLRGHKSVDLTDTFDSLLFSPPIGLMHVHIYVQEIRAWIAFRGNT